MVRFLRYLCPGRPDLVGPVSGRGLIAIAAAILAAPCGAQAPTPTQTPQQVPQATPKLQRYPQYELGAQATFINQSLFPFHSPYQGPNSLQSRWENETSHTYTIYFGDRLNRNVEVYFDPEMARGKGLSDALGLSGFTNGEVIRNPTLGQGVYPARYFARFVFATGRGEEKIQPAENLVAGTRPTHRLVLTVGKYACSDIFETSSFANSPRTQFMNWALINSPAYDYAADTRGYTRGVALEWIQPNWAVRIGSFQMPTEANGPVLATDLIHNRGDQAELELHPRVLGHRPDPLILRFLLYRNFGHMGNYRDALRLAQQTGTTPDITAVEMPGAVKYGYGLNFEQALGDGGNTGLFGRFTWNDGRTESFVYTECDRAMCLGYQLSGAHWRRPQDRVALALVQEDLSSSHKDYLAAGGLGFILGDGRLNYGPERILETYYAYQLSRFATISVDYQGIANPGYNRDRGPVSVLSVRLHVER